MELVDLDECVVSALELFAKNHVPELKLERFNRPLVVGSGNAAVTGKIIQADADAVFADEGTYEEKLKDIPNIDGALLISASGGKHAPIIAQKLKEKGIHVDLMTCNPDAAAKEFVDHTIVTPKQTEPYTYNTSTYMGMILEHSKENPKVILNFIKEKVDPLIPKNLIEYKAFYIIVEPKFDAVRELFMTKFDELFGPILNGRVFTTEQTKHAKTVVPYDKELFISFGYKNEIYGENRLNIPLPDNAGPATLMAIGYYVIGKIQKQNPPYFKQNIESYAKKASELFGEDIKPIVD